MLLSKIKQQLLHNKDILTILFGRVAQIILSIITIRIITEFLSPYEFGRMGIILAILGFIGFFLINPIGMYINRHIIGWNNEGKVKLHLYYYVFYIVSVSALASLVFLILKITVGIGLDILWWWLIGLIILYIMTNVANMTIIPSLNLLGNRLAFVNLTLLTLITNLVFSIILIKLFQPNMEYWILGQIIGYALISIAGWYIFAKKLNNPDEKISYKLPKISYKLFYPILIFAIPLSMSVGLNWVQLQSYRFILANDGGLQILGLFIAGYGISAAVLTAFESIISQYYLPLFYKEVTNSSPEVQAQAWHRYAMLLVPTLVVTIAFVAAVSPYLVKILLADSFQGAQAFVIWGAIAEGFRVLGNCISMGAHAIIDTKKLILPNLIGALAVLTLLFSLKQHIDPSGATGIALAGGGLIFVLFLYFYLNKYITLYIKIVPVIISVIISIPIFLLFKTAEYYIQHPTLILSLCITGVIGIYYLFAQFIIFKQWSKNQ